MTTRTTGTPDTAPASLFDTTDIDADAEQLDYHRRQARAAVSQGHTAYRRGFREALEMLDEGRIAPPDLRAFLESE